MGAHVRCVGAADVNEAISAGFSEEPAIGVVEALREIDASALVTKSDLKESVADLKVDILRWLFVSQLALGGFISAAFKLVH